MHMYMLEGISSVAGFTAYEESQWGWGSHFLICSVFFVSKGNLFDVYFTTLQLVLVPCGGDRTSPVHGHSADSTSFPLYHWPHYGIFENKLCTCIC